MADELNDDVRAALAILRDVGFPVERIRILPAEAAANDDEPPIDRGALLSACLALLADGQQHAARDLARDLRDQFPGVTRKHINSVLSVEGKGDVFYDRAAYTYSLAAPADTSDW